LDPAMDTRTPLPEVPEIARVPGMEDCTAEIDGIRWRYLRAGSGPVLLVIHGFMSYSFSWRFVLQELAQHYSVYAVDLPNCGFSERSSRYPGTLESDVEHVLSFLDHHGIERCDVLGTSRGGGLAIALAGLLAERGIPGRLRRLVLSAPINPWMRYGMARVRFARTRLGRFYLVRLARKFPFIMREFFRKLYVDGSRIPADSFEGYRAGLEPAGSFEHLWNVARSWMDDLKRIESVLPLVEPVPALLLWGDRDRVVAVSSAEELHARWKNSVVAMMERMGHMPYEEAPREFNRIVLDFLLRGTPSTPLEKEERGLATAENSRA